MTIHIIRSNINPLELIIETAGFTRIVLTVHGHMTREYHLKGGGGGEGGGEEGGAMEANFPSYSYGN